MHTPNLYTATKPHIYTHIIIIITYTYTNHPQQHQHKTHKTQYYYYSNQSINQSGAPTPIVNTFGSPSFKNPLWSTPPVFPTSSYGNAYPLPPTLTAWHIRA